MKRTVQPFGNGRVRLRLLEENDAEMVVAWRNRDSVRCWFKSSDVISVAQHLKWYSNYATRDDDFVFIVTAVDGRPVGQVSVYAINQIESNAEVGRFIAAPQEEGKGFIRDACKGLFDYCSHQLKLKEVYLDVIKTNKRAITLYQQLGFVEDEHVSSNNIMRMKYIL